MTDPTDTMLLTAANNASRVISAIYEHVDEIARAGGIGTEAGRRLALALAESLALNREAARRLVFEPLETAIRERASRL